MIVSLTDEGCCGSPITILCTSYLVLLSLLGKLTTPPLILLGSISLLVSRFSTSSISSSMNVFNSTQSDESSPHPSASLERFTHLKSSAIPALPFESRIRPINPSNLPIIPSELLEALARTRPPSSTSASVAIPGQVEAFTGSQSIPTTSNTSNTSARKLSNALTSSRPVRSKLSKLVSNVTNPSSTHHQPDTEAPTRLVKHPGQSTSFHHPQGDRNRSLGILPEIALSPVLFLDLQPSDDSGPVSSQTRLSSEQVITSPISASSKRKNPESASTVRNLFHLRSSTNSQSRVTPHSSPLGPGAGREGPVCDSAVTLDHTTLDTRSVPGSSLQTVSLDPVSVTAQGTEPEIPELDHQSSRSSLISLPDPIIESLRSQPPAMDNLSGSLFPDSATASPDPVQQGQHSHLTTPKAKETIWHRIGFPSSAFGSSSSGSQSKKLLLKQHQHSLAAIPADHLRDSNPPQNVGTSSDPPHLPPVGRPRSSFSFDHYIQSHLSTTSEKKQHLAQRRSPVPAKDSLAIGSRSKSKAPTTTQSGSFRSKFTSSIPEQDAQDLTQSDTKMNPLSLDPSGRTSLEQSSIESHHSPNLHLDQSHSSMNFPQKLRHNIPHSLLPTTEPEWRSSHSATLDDSQEDDNEDVPWPNRENFTHDLQAARRRDRSSRNGREQDLQIDDGCDEDESLHSNQSDDQSLRGSSALLKSAGIRRPHHASTGSADSPHSLVTSNSRDQPTASATMAHGSQVSSSPTRSGFSTPSSVVARQRPIGDRPPQLPLLPFRLPKEVRQTVGTQGMRRTLESRGLSAALGFDPLLMKVKSITEPASGAPTLPRPDLTHASATPLEVPHTAPISRSPAFNFEVGPHTPIYHHGTDSDHGPESPRIRSLSDTLIRRVTRHHHPRVPYAFSDCPAQSSSPTADDVQRAEGAHRVRPRPSAAAKAGKQILEDPNISRPIGPHHLQIFNGTLAHPTRSDKFSGSGDLHLGRRLESTYESASDVEDDIYFIDSAAAVRTFKLPDSRFDPNDL